MPLQESDISWALLHRIVADWLGNAVQLTGVRPLDGGSMSTTLCLSLKDRPKAVLKIASHRVVLEYEQEAYQLNYLRDLGLPTPEVHVCQVANLDFPYSYILMEHMEGIPLSQAKQDCTEDEFDHIQMHLADLVLAMHARTSSTYARVEDGQADGTKSFLEFFHLMYDPIWEQVATTKLVTPGLRRRIASIHAHLDTLLAHDDRPRLMHGDLWSANLLVNKDSRGKWWVSAVLDPNCRYSHYEIELAYLDLFRTVTPAFLRAYEQTHRLGKDYHERRKLVYQLYPLLNHVHLFGAKYIQPLTVMAERVAGLIRHRKAG